MNTIKNVYVWVNYFSDFTNQKEQANLTGLCDIKKTDDKTELAEIKKIIFKEMKEWKSKPIFDSIIFSGKFKNSKLEFTSQSKIDFEQEIVTEFNNLPNW